MAELEYDLKRKGLQGAAELRLMASESPDPFMASELRKTARRFESHYGFSSDEKKIAIRQYIQKCGGSSSIPELCEHFPWQLHVIHRLVGEMTQKGDAQTLEYYDAKPAGPSGKGRHARRIRLIAAISLPPKN